MSAIAYPIQTNFTAGEISPALYGRVDINKYFNAAAEIENFLVLPEGGIQRRSGTRFVTEVKDSTKFTKLVRFEFSTIQAYILEFSELCIRVLKNGGIVISGGDPLEIVTPYTDSEIKSLKFAQSADVLYITHPNHKPRVLTRSSDTSWTLNVLSYRDGPYLVPDITDTELRLENVLNRATLKSSASDFVSGDVGKFVEFIYNGQTLLGEVKTFVSATEVLVEPRDNVVDPKTIDTKSVVTYASASGTFPNRLRATSSIFSTEVENSYVKVGSTWYLLGNNFAAFEEIPEVVGPPKAPAYSVDVIAVTSIPTLVSTTGTLVLSDQSITATLKSSKPTFDSSRDVGRHIRLNLLSEQIWCEITSHTNDSEVALKLGRMVPIDPKAPSKFLASGKTNDWRFGAWYVGHYPSVVTFHEGRLNFFANKTHPQTHWTTTSAGYGKDFAIFSPTDTDSAVLDDSGITRTLDSGKVNSVFWAITGPVLIVGTQGAEWQVKAESINEALTPGNYNAKEQTAWGSEDITPVRLGASVIFVQRGSRIIRELVYSYEIDAHVAQFLTLLSNHLLKEKGGAVSIALQKAPYTRLWVTTGSGELICITYEKDQEVVAFTRQILGGNGVVESTETVPNGNTDSVYVVVKRTINGQTKRYVEYFEEDFWPTTEIDKTDMFFLDSGLSYVANETQNYTQIESSQSFVITEDGLQTIGYIFTVTFDSDHNLVDGEVISLEGSGYEFLNGALYAVNAINPVQIQLLNMSAAGSPGPYTQDIGGDTYQHVTIRKLTDPIIPFPEVSEVAGTVTLVRNKFTNLNHLEGETVQAFVDGSYTDDHVVTDGEVELETYGRKVSIGLSFRSKLKTLPMEAGSFSGTAVGKLKKIHALTVKLLHSIGFQYGPTLDNLKHYSFRKSNGFMDDSPEMFTGEKEFGFNSDVDFVEQYYIVQDLPYNLHIIALAPKLRTTK